MSVPLNFENLFEGAPAAHLVLSPEPDFAILAVNNAFLKISKHSRTSLIGRPVSEAFPDNPNDPAADAVANLQASLHRVLRTRQRDIMGLQKYDEPDPETNAYQERYWSAYNDPVFDPAGNLASILHTVEEVTDLMLQLAEPSGQPLTRPNTLNPGNLQLKLIARTRDLDAVNRSLQAANSARVVSEQRFQQTARHSTFGFMICDRKGDVTYLNPALERLLGYTPEEVARGLVRRDRITPPGFTDQDANAIRDVEERGASAPFEKAYIAKDGHLVPVLVGISALASQDGESEVAAFVLDLTDKVHTEEMLRAAVLKNRTLVESLPQLVWTCSQDGSCTYLSPQWVAFTGIPEQEQLGIGWLGVMHPEDRDRTYQAWRNAVAGTAPYDLDYRIRRHDGAYRWFKTRGVPVHDETGSIREWFGTCTDVDDQIRSEQQLHQAVEERERLWREYDSALSNTPDLSYSFDLKGRFSYANRAFLQLVQKPIEQVLGYTFADLDYPPELARTLEAQIRIVIQTARAIRADSSYTDPSGVTRQYEHIFVPVISDGRVELVTGSARDITERKDAEETLRESEQRLRFALQAGRMNSWEFGPTLPERNAGAWANGVSGSVESWNSASLRRFLTPEEASRVEQQFDRALQSGSEVETEFCVRAKDDSEAWLWIRAAPQAYGVNQLRLSGLISDVTARRSMEERFRESARLESVGVLAGGIAHDFNNLLTGILGNSSLAMEAVGAGHEAYPLLEGVLRASERAATLTNQMLAYSGRGRFVIRRIELSSFLRDVSSLIKASVPRHVHLQLNLEHALPLVQADVTQMQQVIMNLIVNAAEAIPAERQGLVTVRTFVSILNAQELANLRNSFDAVPGPYVCLAVQDNGSGMDSGTLQKMFDPFFTTKFTGRGLGLSAVLGILRGHKGAVGIESVVGKGTRICVYLPATEGVPEEKAPLPAPLAGQGTILVVDDEETVRAVARNMLRHAGYSVLSANDGEEAVRLFRLHHQELRAVVLDLSMPVMSGESALPLMQKINPSVPVILSTGYSEMETSARFDHGKLAALLPKPYDMAQFNEALRQALERTNSL